MARFRLTDKHYINIMGCEWEEKQELMTKVRGRNRLHKKSMAVPMYLDPKDSSDHNYPGEIIISTKEDLRRYPDDYIVGPGFVVTADMIDLDDEAAEMMEEYKASYKGEHPIESLSGTMAEDILAKLSRQLDAVTKLQPVAPAQATMSNDEVERLKADNADLRAKLDAIMERLNMVPEVAKVEGNAVRRI